MGDHLRGLSIALSFLTRLRSDVGEVDEADLRLAPGWFPMVGAVVGLIAGGGYATAIQFLPSLLAATLAIGLGIMVTGGFHEDGLADTADSFGSGAVGQPALDIMCDSRIGTFGTIALVFSVIWRVVAVASMGPTLALVGLIVAHSLSRAGAVALIALAPPARQDGLARSLVEAAGPYPVLFATGTALAVGAALAGLWIVPALSVVAITVAWLRRSALRRLGGITGDVLGATEQIGEMAVLAVFAAASWRAATLWWL